MAVSEEMNFGQAVKRLEEIVKHLEQDEVALEESSTLFEEGIKLAQLCTVRLQETEEKIERLTKEGTGKIAISPAEQSDE